VYPTSPFLTIARGTFSKALDLPDFWQLFIPLLIAIPLVIDLSFLLLKQQEGCSASYAIVLIWVSKSCAVC
ncbi:hypothetical protein FGG80_26680, partial [Escherichia coli]